MPLTAAEKARRYRQKINEDPEKRAEYLRKCRERAAKQKRIGDLSEREKRAKRKKWRQNQQRSRRQKIENLEQLKRLEENTPPSSPVPDADPVPEAAGVHEYNRVAGRRRVAKRKSASYRKIQQLEQDLDILQKSKDRYKKRYLRVKEKLKKPDTPKNVLQEDLSPFTKMSVETKGYNVPDQVKRQLVIHNALLNQIQDNYSNSSSELEKQIVSSTVEGDILKKYKCQTNIKQKIGCFAKKVSKKVDKNISRRKRRSNIHYQVVRFFCRDDVTTLTPGKKQTVVRGKIKKQKRLLRDNLRVLHAKFSAEISFKISFATFCRHRPYWVVRPRLSDRDSCLCKKHSNMQFQLDVLVKEKLLSEKNIESLCSSVTCENDSKACMLNTCEQCKFKEPIDMTKIENKEKIVKHFLWKLEKQEVTKRDKKFIVTKTVKVEVKEKLSDLSSNFNKEFRTAFCPHVYRKNHQTKQRQKCIAELAYDEAAVHIDFSENYLCKMNEEIQAMHFGSSHNQASLHTVVTYSEDGTNTICTISPSKRHDPCAIWAHLMPVLAELREKNIDTVHFFSDGPTTQYRNKDNFYFLRTIFTNMGFKYATWNFSEASHGKGAPDGVGAAIKRVADGIVSKGEDIPNANILFERLQGKTAVKLFLIPEEKIIEMENKKPTDESIDKIKGIMKIGQVILSGSNSEFKSRNLSCFCKKFPAICSCHNPVDIIRMDRSSSVNPTSLNIDESLHPRSDLVQYKIGDWIVVKFNDILYPGIITNKKENTNKYEVSVLYSVGYNKYVWPTKEDKIWYSLADIFYNTEPPKNLTKRILTFANAPWINHNFED